MNSFVSGSAGDESINAFTDTGPGGDVESGVPGAAGALDVRKPVGVRYTDSPARGSGTLAVPLGTGDATVAGVTGRRCAARSEATGGVAGGWYG